MTPPESLIKMIDVIDKMAPDRTESGINNYDGTIIPW